MSKQIGLVTRICSQGLTEVLTERRSACSGCQTTHGCNTCLSTAKIKAKVHNPIGARPGDLVEIYMHNRAVLQGALILYGFPLIGLLFGAIVGAGWIANHSTASVLFAVAGLVLGLALAVALGNSRYAKQYLVPTITKVITPVVPTR